MAERSMLGPLLIAAGVGLAVVGVLVWMGALSWFGRLPGDIRIERPGFRFYFPVTTMIIVSLVLTTLAWLFRRL